MVAAFDSYNHHTACLRYWGFWVACGQNDVITPWLRLTATTNYSYYICTKCFKHTAMLFIVIWWQPYTVIPILLGSDFGFWVACEVKMMTLHLG
jgi:hypothetical protein